MEHGKNYVFFKTIASYWLKIAKDYKAKADRQHGKFQHR